MDRDYHKPTHIELTIFYCKNQYHPFLLGDPRSCAPGPLCLLILSLIYPAFSVSSREALFSLVYSNPDFLSDYSVTGPDKSSLTDFACWSFGRQGGFRGKVGIMK